jgi:membrane protein required for colicin V production
MSSSFNAFDAGLMIAVVISAIVGTRAGLIRSLASILGYVAAAPLAAAIAPRLSVPTRDPALPWVQDFGVFFVVFLAIGMGISALLRFAAAELLGPGIHPADRLAGGGLGAIRIVLVAVAVIMVFDHILPEERQPPILRTSQLKPILSSGGRFGLRTLPPELAAQIDQIRRDRRI